MDVAAEASSPNLKPVSWGRDRKRPAESLRVARKAVVTVDVVPTLALTFLTLVVKGNPHEGTRPGLSSSWIQLMTKSFPHVISSSYQPIVQDPSVLP